MNARIAAGALVAASLLLEAPCFGDPASVPYQSSPERRTVKETRDWGPWAGPFRAKLVPSMMRDFGERYLYAQANAQLPPPTRGERRVVFLGDSITDGWNLAAAFPDRSYVNRGIGTQVTAQMLLRFEQDVVALHPAAVVILAGTNDLTGFLQVETPETIVANITAMTDIADARGIRTVLCSILPVNSYTEAARSTNAGRSPAMLRAINAALRDLARRRGYAYADYATSLTDERGQLGADYANDGLHPNALGYRRMAPVVAAAIAQVLRDPVTSPRRQASGE